MGKYTKKEFMENIRTLTSPFENIKPNGQGKGGLRGMAEDVMRVLGRNKGMKPQ